jgi:hypothetical protein
VSLGCGWGRWPQDTEVAAYILNERSWVVDRVGWRLLGRTSVRKGKPQGKKPLGRPRCRWEDNNRMDVKKLVVRVLTGFIWFRIGARDRLL